MNSFNLDGQPRSQDSEHITDFNDDTEQLKVHAKTQKQKQF